MKQIARTSTALMLLLLMALLPLTASYAVSHASADEMRAFVSANGAHAGCKMADHHDCKKLQTEKSNHDDCCKNHCDSSFGAQICTDTSLTADIPCADTYADEDSGWAPNPEPSLLLRPPLPLS